MEKKQLDGAYGYVAPGFETIVIQNKQMLCISLNGSTEGNGDSYGEYSGFSSSGENFEDGGNGSW